MWRREFRALGTAGAEVPRHAPEVTSSLCQLLIVETTLFCLATREEGGAERLLLVPYLYEKKF